KRGRGRFVVDRIHSLKFEEVIARAQAAELVEPARKRPVADLVHGGIRDGSAVLAPVQVTLPSASALDHPTGAAGQRGLQFQTGQPPDAVPTDATRDPPTKSVDQLGYRRAHLVQAHG